MAEQQVIHMAPPAERVPQLMADLFGHRGPSADRQLGLSL